MRASEHDGAHPRPTLVRDAWTSLDGAWAFAHDDGDEGLAGRWFEPGTTEPFGATIQVPFPPESPASGIAEPGFHPVVWYRRVLTHEELLDGRPEGGRSLLHFGAVDHHATVWVDGRQVADHVGGQTPFTADLTDAWDPAAGEHVLVVRAQDDPAALDQPRGKQDWREQPHGIWYERTTGIWQTVWLEPVPRLHVVDLAWTPDLVAGLVRGEVRLSGTPASPVRVEVACRVGDEVLAETSSTLEAAVGDLVVVVPALHHGQDRARLLWSPESPTLVDVEVVVRDRATGDLLDTVSTYVGLRSASVGGGVFELNGQPYYVRSVLDQGYRPETHLAARDTDELRTEVERIKAMGFNAVRVHQKAEDPRFLYWADVLGLLVWSETAGAYAFSPTAVTLLTREWLELVRRYRGHPSVVTWVPVNESWGVQDIAVSPAQQQFTQALASLTRALDPSRPVLSNEGWEHVDSDVLGVHDYTTDPEELRSHYATREAAVATVCSAHGPQGRRPVLTEHQTEAFLAGRAPLMVTEFGGISLSHDAESWGYAQAGSSADYATLLTGLFGALRACPEVAGFCYTQFMDTGQETNGLLFADGTPKLPLDAIREIVTGLPAEVREEASSTFGWAD